MLNSPQLNGPVSLGLSLNLLLPHVTSFKFTHTWCLVSHFTSGHLCRPGSVRYWVHVSGHHSDRSSDPLSARTSCEDTREAGTGPAEPGREPRLVSREGVRVSFFAGFEAPDTLCRTWDLRPKKVKKNIQPTEAWKVYIITNINIYPFWREMREDRGRALKLRSFKRLTLTSSLSSLWCGGKLTKLCEYFAPK